MNLRAASFFAFVMAATLSAQDTYLPGEVEDGRQLFRASCEVCHGPDGDFVPGVDLGHGKFRRAASAADLIQIIKNGIPGTRMPSNDYSDFEAGNIVAYLRFMESTSHSTSVPGDAARGRVLFDGKGGCLGCHRVRGRGSRVGPDLTEIGSRRRALELRRSLLEPDAEILPQNRFIRVVAGSGETITGRLLNHDAFTVQLID